MMVRRLSYPLLYLIPFISLLSVTLAADEPSQGDNEDVTWLYPSLAAPSLTFNILDTINVTWISTHTPAFLKLSCQKGTVYTTALELPVPATGNRLLSLMILSSTNSISSTSYDSCHFELSSPTNFTNLSQSVSFNLTAISTQEPAFWSLDSSTFSSSSEKYLEQQARAQDARCKNKNTSTSAMAAIGVGVAVGVFALTTACFVLYEVQRRKKLQAAAMIEGHDGHGQRMSGLEPVHGKSIAKKTLNGGGGGGGANEGGREAPQHHPPRGTMNDFTQIKRSHEGDAGAGQRQGEQRFEVQQEPIFELESPHGGRYA
ncbi:MAG: hypothetical protein Q9169_000291 [Polycauliona sp. 2 TL-2023]